MSGPGIFKSIIASEYYVIVFDLCSSSVILEELQRQNKLKVWRRFWGDCFSFLNRISIGNTKSIIYKFVGDGFILLYKPLFENDLIEFCEKIKEFINDRIHRIVNENIENFNSRLGITVGIAKGKVIRMRLYGNREYMGRSINIAARLQALLKSPTESNHILVSDEVMKTLRPQLEERSSKKRTEILHNIQSGEEFICYEIEMK